MADHRQLLARNVRRFRRERGLSMSTLAQIAGLSKQTLSSIEQGAGNPTVETLSVLSKALEIPVRRLLTEWGTPVFVQRADEGEWFSSTAWSERILDEVYGSGYVRTAVLQLERCQPAGKPISPHDVGVLHHLYVVSGRVRTGPATEPVDLAAEDFTRFPGDVPHLLHALTGRATVHIVTTEPQLRQIRESGRRQ
jgi:transcriptional regulator with XRE-family HTH domain